MTTTDVSQLRRLATRRIEALPEDTLTQVISFLDNLTTHHAISTTDRVAPVEDDKLAREMMAFSAMREQLLPDYDGEYVAVHNGQIVDHDRSLRNLYLRVYAISGRAQVLMKQVSPEPDGEILLRSPWRLEPSGA